MSEIKAQRVINSPIGDIAIAADDKGVVKIDIMVDRGKSQFSDSQRASQICDQAAIQLADYFAGDRKIFDVPLSLSGTEFQLKVWNAIAAVGFGQQLSYKEIAAIVGKPLAARAIGGAVGANPVPLLIGCHRVLGSGGKITGYSGGEGLKTKRWLLSHEQIGYAND